jgi:hypothetical protein
MSKYYAAAESLLSEIKKERQNLASETQLAAELPGQLSAAFREAADPKLEQAIAAANERTMGGAIEGLDKFQHILNPFKRRSLAEQYQGSLSLTAQSLTDEQARRQGVMADYVQRYGDTYGARAKASQIRLQGLQQEFGMQMQIGGRYEAAAERARARQEKAEKFDTLSDEEITSHVRQLKDAGKNEQEISEYLADRYGVDTAAGSHFDVQAAKAFGRKDPRIKEPTAKQQAQDQYYTLLQQIQSGNNPQGYEIDEETGNIIQPAKKPWFRSNTPEEIISRKI